MRKIILKSTSPPKYSPDHQVGHVFMYNKVAVMILLDGPAPEKWQVLQSLSKVARLITKLYLGSRKHCFTSIALQYQIVSQAIVPQQSYTGASLPGGLAARWPWEAKREKKPVATTVALSQRDLFFFKYKFKWTNQWYGYEAQPWLWRRWAHPSAMQKPVFWLSMLLISGHL